MNRINNHYKQIASYDLLTKFNYTNSFQLPNIEKISINFSSLNVALEKKKIIQLLLAIELITGYRGKITISKKNRIHLKIKKGMVMGCKVTLATNESYIFLDNLITLVLPNTNNFKGFKFNEKKYNILSFKIDNFLSFFELQNEFMAFSNMPSLDLSIIISSKNSMESNLLLNSLNFPIKK
jgi:large subunit ribosomal protein L5